ncbi:hypothetical protein CORC01_02304 [Colletotrichum orchidophilum]|uniref:DUF7702 domain-containing protein n=1 Tax=Colletotrichum orchidophilum TaxID=1209926 RepID=A0A1G4BLJ3_9PEZI|nr:uncharacterized protein CORC01_02304 [Colletotrichum orchidophilum]OHF02311.1 hypothetical protein CORC01_02304 [Colletotrichum orchidophilum]
MAETAAHTFSPVSNEVVNLAIAELVLYGLMFPPAIWITWKHGKKGMVCWPILVSHFGMRFIADIYQVVKRNETLLPNQFNIMTSAGSLACLSLTLIGIVYEANIILPGSPKRWNEKILLGITHLCNTAGIGMATYGGSPSHEGGLINNTLNQIGNCLELFMIFAVCAWLWPTYKKIRSSSRPNCLPAMFMIRAAVVGLPFQLIHLAYTTTYAFNQISSLDPVMGSFGTKLVLIFGTYLGVTIAILAGGWLGMSTDVPKAMQVEPIPTDVEGNNNHVRD